MSEYRGEADETHRRAPGRGVMALAMLGALALVYGRFFVGYAPAGDDIVDQYIPYQHLIRTSIVEHGEWPYWNPMTFCGRPLMGDIQVGVLYPPNWMHWALPLPLGFTLLLLAHAGFALWGAYALGRAWNVAPPAAMLGAVLFVFGAFFTAKLHSGVVLFHYAAAWLPWQLLAATGLWRRPGARRLALLALTLALGLLSGSPQMTFYAWLLTAGFAFVLPFCDRENAERRGAVARFWTLAAAAFALALALTLAQTFQTWHMVGVSFDRAQGASWDYITHGSLPPRLLGLFVNPGLFGPGWSEEFYWGGDLGFAEALGYLPIWTWLALIPAGCLLLRRGSDANGAARDASFHSRLCPILALVALLGLILALGRHTPVYRFFFRFAPGFDMFRVPARHLFFVAVGASGLAALVYHRWLQRSLAPSDERRLRLLLVLTGLIGAAALILTYTARESLWRLWDAPVTQVQAEPVRELLRSRLTPHLLTHALRGLIFLAAAAGALAWLRKLRSEDASLPDAASQRRIPTRLAPWTIPALAALELAMLAWPLQKAERISAYEETFYPETPLVQTLKEHDRGGRVLWLDSLLDWRFDQNHPEVLRNALIMQGIPDARGYDPVNARWIGEWMNYLADLPPGRNPLGQMFVPRLARPPMATLMGVDRILSYNDLSGVPGIELIRVISFPERPLGVWRNAYSGGLAFAVPAAAFADGRAEARQATARRSGLPAEAPRAMAGEFPMEHRRAAVLDARMREKEPPLSDEIDGAFRVGAIRQGPNEFRYAVDFPRAAALWLAQSAYPGWRATVDGEPVEVFPAAGAFLALRVPAGRHEVVFRYAPPRGYARAAAVSLAALAVLAVMLAPGKGGNRPEN